jgi:hypothetical protein
MFHDSKSQRGIALGVKLKIGIDLDNYMHISKSNYFIEYIKLKKN